MSWVMFAARRYHGMRHFVVSTYLVDPEKVGRLAEIPFTCIHEVKRLALLILHGTLCQLNWISRLLEWEEAGANNVHAESTHKATEGTVSEGSVTSEVLAMLLFSPYFLSYHTKVSGPMPAIAMHTKNKGKAA